MNEVTLKLPYGFAQLFILENDYGNTGWERGGALDSADAAAKIVANGYKKGNYWYVPCTKAEGMLLAEEFTEIYHPQGVIYERVHSSFTSKSDRLQFANYMRTAKRYAPQVFDACIERIGITGTAETFITPSHYVLNNKGPFAPF